MDDLREAIEQLDVVLESNPQLLLGLLLLMIWELFWKGLGMWYAVSEKKVGWFVWILITNTAGLLPIIYIFYFSKTYKRTGRLIPKRTSK